MCCEKVCALSVSDFRSYGVRRRAMYDVMQIHEKLRLKIVVDFNAIDGNELVVDVARQLPQIRKYTKNGKSVTTFFVPVKVEPFSVTLLPIRTTN